MTGRWLRVSKSRPCEQGCTDWCTYLEDGTGYCCMRVQSDTPTANGGWFHKTGSTDKPKPFIPAPVSAAPPLPPPDWDAMMIRWHRWTTACDVSQFAVELGVLSVALANLSIRWAPEHRAWAFPMRNGDNEIVGIRLRNKLGQKWAVKGSHQGIFIPQHAPPQDIVYICEGPTDTAAMISYGFYAVGRPSCVSGGPDILRHCHHQKIRRAVIVVDNDTPGRNGAKKLVGEISGMRYVYYTPTAKDVRELRRMGATREDIESAIKNMLWLKA